MAKVIIAGTTANIVSELGLGDIQKAERYAPKSLKLMSDDGKTVVFAVGSTTGTGTINQYGVSFAASTFDGNSKATVSIEIPAGTEDAKKFVTESFAYALINLNKVEKQIADALDGVKADLTAVAEDITIA